MQSSFNVIKNSRVIEQGNREIKTQLREVTSVDIMDEIHESKKEYIKSFENMASNILVNARRQSEKIISKAYIDSTNAKMQAIKEGQKEGYEKGYNEAIGKAMDAAKNVRTMADDLLVTVKEEYNQYLIDKQQHIKALVLSIAQNILKREIVEKDALNEMIFDTIKAERDIKSYIIKSNSSHFDNIKEQIENWKSNLAFQGDIFVIEDNFLDDGTAVIEKDTGKSIVSIAYGIEKIIEVFQEEQIQI